MQELKMIFPYGLNSRLDIEGIHDAYDHVKSNMPKPIYKAFNTIKNSHTHRGSGINRMKNRSNDIHNNTKWKFEYQ